MNGRVLHDEAVLGSGALCFRRGVFPGRSIGRFEALRKAQQGFHRIAHAAGDLAFAHDRGVDADLVQVGDFQVPGKWRWWS